MTPQERINRLMEYWRVQDDLDAILNVPVVGPGSGTGEGEGTRALRDDSSARGEEADRVLRLGP